MNVEITFFLVNGEKVNYVESMYSNVGEVVDVYKRQLGTKTNIKVDDATVVSLEYVTHLTAKEIEGSPEVNTPDTDIREVSGRTWIEALSLEGLEARNFLTMLMQQTYVKDLAKQWGVDEHHVRNLYEKHDVDYE